MTCYTSPTPLSSDPRMKVTKLLPHVLYSGSLEAQGVRRCQNQLEFLEPWFLSHNDVSRVFFPPLYLTDISLFTLR